MTVTVGEMMDALIGRSGVSVEDTVDLLITGSRDMVVQGIAVAFMPTRYVLEEAVRRGANLLIVHEPMFFRHQGGVEFLENDPVYADKLAYLRDTGLAVFRLHDHIHRYHPDAITAGLVEALGWEQYVEKHLPTAAILEISELTAAELAAEVKSKLELNYVRLGGDPGTMCRRIGILVGYRGGGASAIPLFHEEQLDVIIAGEGPEWETPEYVRDAAQQGLAKALIMIGHAESEVPGMQRLVPWLQEKAPDVEVSFVAEKPVFRLI
ncbi:Nif3-like dinuclear metal center hexameric protein [Paenibacillus sp. JX-17]|uniref:GTP cyclohydrolase 1 type 2 homolog n=1 Tax=Paenibacillus lacisoli TaxID=3064525 RepID=A0ABT9C9R2_9BACL|nr:Nif3-like dinuclear metal center hexameric protein [Paenibacillus sp. JX-17]MDO7905971.1 Nif3-like dinuclear metal center hexameric protein [Paenibacillus sp. JX-17]